MKRIIALFIVLMMLVPLAACESGRDQGSSNARTEEATAVPAAKETDLPTGEPTEAAPTEAADEPADARVEAAWAAVQTICGLYGLTVNKLDGRIEEEPLTGATIVSYLVPDEEDAGGQIRIRLEQADDGEWAVCGETLALELADGAVDSAKFESDLAELAFAEMTVTADELKEAGLGSEPGDAAEYAARKYAARFTECAEANYFRCRKAAPVKVEQKGETNAYETRLAMLPELPRCFSIGYGDIMGPLYLHGDGEEEFSELDYYFTVYFNINAERNDDGSFRVFVDYLE